MNDTFFSNYADVLLEAVNLQAGQCLLVRAEPCLARFAGVLARQAYKRGAKYVRYDQSEVENPYLYEARVTYSKEEYLDFLPAFRAGDMEEMIEGDWALIAVKGQEDPACLERLDPARNARCAKAVALAMKEVQRRVSSNEIAWLVAFMPTEGMAAKIMGMEPGKAALEGLWKVLAPILSLDAPDPAAAFRARSEVLVKRAETLNALALDSLHFTGPGTDLTIGLARESLWRGGPDLTKKGIKFNPNLPTEEVFTSPDWRRTEGRVAFTRPVLVPILGKIVEGGWLEFSGGVATAWGADQGKEVLDAYFAIDEGARKLGEVALVDADSPIARSGKTFFNILLDENASCHIALGSCYESCYRGGESLGEAGRARIGANDSSVHTDFMIGGDLVSVRGQGAAGKKVDIILNGKFVN